MKYLIVGRQGSGIIEIIRELENLGVSVGHIFRSIQDLSPTTYTLSQIVYKNDDIEKIESTDSYIFMQESSQNEKFIEGLSFYEYDNHDVIYMSVDHLAKISESVWKKMDVTIVWLDNTSDYRMNALCDCSHNIRIQEDNESQYITGFVERVYEKPHLYFFNEDPERISTIIYSIVKYPDLLDIFLKKFN